MLSMSRLAGLATVAACVAGCGDNGDKLAACRAIDDGLGGTAQASEVQDRKIIGVAAPYVPDLGLAARDAELRGSMAARRAAAWQVVAKVLAPVAIAEPQLIERFGSATLPAWATWYHRDDFERIFKRLYADLGPDGRRARAPFTAAAIAAGEAWNPTAIDELESWPEQRYLDYLDAIDTPEELASVGEVRRVAYSPGAMNHLLGSYPEALACRIAGVPAAFVDGVTDPARDVVAREAPVVADCELRVLGPFQVADGAELRATLQGVGGDVDLYVRRGAPPTLDAYDCRSPDVGAVDTCTVTGGGPVYVGLLGVSSDGPRAVPVDIAFRQADRVRPACLAAPFPADAVVIKAAWSRDFDGTPVPTFDTSAAAMGDRLDETGAAAWGDGSGGTLPGPDAIYTLDATSGARFRLTGLHIMSKELPHWMWITLWWSPTPDDDFGADRPAAVAALPGPWANYKMSVNVAYLEEDLDVTGGATGTLADALAATHGGVGQPTWTSNPFIELGAGNAATNCIGCHQHGGTDLTSEAIISGAPEFPHHGRTQLRNNFATDYSWAVLGGRGDELAAIIQNEADYWDTAD